MSVSAGMSAAAPADTVPVVSALIHGPYPVASPHATSSKDAAGRAFTAERLLDYPLAVAGKGVPASLDGLTVTADGLSTGVITFAIKSKGYCNVTIPVTGTEAFKVTVDGKEADKPVGLRPGSHEVSVAFVAAKDARPRISVVPSVAGAVEVSDGSAARDITLNDILHGDRFTGTSLSADGTMALVRVTTTHPGGKTTRSADVYRTSDGKKVATVDAGLEWMPASPLLYGTRMSGDERQLYTLNPTDGSVKVLSHNLPEGGLLMSPTEDFVAINVVTKGPKEGEVYQILEPEDRQPGWRDRRSVVVRDLRNGLTRPLTFGAVTSWATDISADGGKVLVMSQRSRLAKRPTQIFDILLIDTQTARCDTLVSGDGFVENALFSPDATKVLVKGCAEAFDGAGLNLPEGRTSSMSDGQLYILDIASRKVDPITRDFDPAVNGAEWSRADGKIYLVAEDYDYIRLFSYDPATRKFDRAVSGEDIVANFALPRKGRNIVWVGQGASNSDRLYVTDSARKRNLRLAAAKDEQLAGVRLSKCEEWNFVNSRGDTVQGRFYLPADFDPAKKYPVIVNYYGGCAPIERTFESRYPHQVYAAQGYVVYVINPSGCTGRGQEWSSRHVNTAGEGVAQDIIEGTKEFCRTHDFADSTRVGCIGASYGGFMTQYLQTVTDIFAAAISHAGISDHTSYWGEGYWGYSYSELAMANSYPWKDRDLYVGQSPLYNADKIHTPLLFLHGDADHNVPVGESIQMFTALKLLGRPTAFVAVADQDHHILDYDKRIKWQDTIFAWFDKYLKGDSSHWNALYPPKEL